MKQVLITAWFLIFTLACTDEPVETVFFDLDISQGVFIACEGNFMYGNGSLSYYNAKKKKVTNHLFYARNNVPLGDVVQSLERFEKSLFIVVNNSGKIVVADAGTIEYKGSVTGLVSPRYIHFVSSTKAYISDLHANLIAIFNPETLEVTGVIPIGEHTSEQMVQVGKYIYASDWSYGSSLLVIDSDSDELVDEIEVPLQPKDLAVDRNGKVWVLSDGGFEGSPAGNDLPAISRIDPETRTIEQIYRFKNGETPSNLQINSTGDTLLFLNRHLYKMHIASRQLPDSACINGEQNLFYRLATDPLTNEIYIADAIDYTQDAIVYRYSPSCELIDSLNQV
jgi:DNA-binding beta-propeller fold protein YncE